MENLTLTKLCCTCKGCIDFAIYTPLQKVASDEAERTSVRINLGKFISQFWVDIITSIQQLEQIKIRICRQKSFILSIASSSCHASSTDFLDSPLPLISIVHRFWQVFSVTSCVHTELLLISSSWPSNTFSSMWRGPEENVTYEFVSPAFLVCRTWMVLKRGGRWSYSCCFVGCCYQELFNISHHLVVPSAWISLTLSRHTSLSFIASSRSSGLHPVSSQSCCM